MSASPAWVHWKACASQTISADRCSCRIPPGPAQNSDGRICCPTCVWLNSSAVPIQPAALELLTALAPVLARWGRWFVFDAQAVTVYRRPKDLDDARALWRLHGGSLDADRIRHALQLLQEALSQSDLVRAFEALARPSRPD